MKTARQSGVTLAEALMAIVILGTSVVAGLELFGYQHSSTLGQSQAWTAQRFLQREYEWVRVVPYEQLSSSSFEDVAEDASYQIGQTVSALDANSLEIELVIRWINQRGLVQTRSVTTVRCEGVGL